MFTISTNSDIALASGSFLLNTPVEVIMAGKGRKVTFHGAFSTKRKAVSKEKSVGGYIRKVTIRGKRRFLVLKRKG